MRTEMENKIHKSIFESAFDSFELDDGFLLKVDADLRKHKINIKDSDTVKSLNHISVNKSDTVCKVNQINDKKTQFEDLSLFLEDLNESDFFERSKTRNKNSAKDTNSASLNGGNAGLASNVTGCLSPILNPKPKNKINKSFSSTPLKSNRNSDGGKEVKNSDENFSTISEYAYLEADLFDDWGEEANSQKDSITLSQAFQLIEEAESARQSNEKDLNTSVDLVTGRPVETEVKDLFTESFNLPNMVESQSKKDKSNDCIIIYDKSDSKSKSPASQKLNFGIDFNSDDDFEFLTQELLCKPSGVKSQQKCFSPENSIGIIRKRKCCRIIESDSTDDSPDVKLNRRLNEKRIRRKKNDKRVLAKEFIESEAEVSDAVQVFSDEFEDEGDYDASFVDDELYLTQNFSANMTAKYLESVKDYICPGKFKIPSAKPYSPTCVFSQVPEDNNTEYELDSFCVNEVEDDIKTDLSDLEIAENILEMDRKKRKRKRILKKLGKIK